MVWVVTEGPSIVPCGFCGQTFDRMHKDHIVPRSRGGGDDARNCIVSCPGCNLEKSNRLPSEWKPTGLPAWIYEIEPELVKRYKMTPRSKRRSASTHFVCYFCGEPFASVSHCFIEFYDQESGSKPKQPLRKRTVAGQDVLYASLAYPLNGEEMVRSGQWAGYERVALFAHSDCGPDSGYWVRAEDVIVATPHAEDDCKFGECGYMTCHLRSKLFWWSGGDEALTRLRDWAAKQ
jgi:hypothetical protein